MLESRFQKRVIDEVKVRLPGCIVLKLDPTYIQGMPDLLILYENRWATLENKKSYNSPHQPNQDYYVELMAEMSFSAFIYPENMDQVLDDLEDYMYWNDHKREMPEGSHSLLSPSTHSWLNYSDEKMAKCWASKEAVKRGTNLHDLACRLIRMKVKLPEDGKTLSMYVNDAISFGMDPEVKLYYSKYCFGTADAISTKDNFIRIHDLKTGKLKASMLQLKIYLALFFLEYPEYKPGMVEGMEIRIYQSNDVRIEKPEADEILPIMDKIVHFDKMLTRLEDAYDEQFDSYWGGT